MKNRILLSAILLIFGYCGFAQEVSVQQIDKNTFSFSTKNMVLIEDFSLDGPSYHITDDAYQFSISALNANGEPDQAVKGKFMFTVNGQLKEVTFTDGKAVVEHELGKADVVKVQLANTNVEKSIEISRFSGTPAFLGFAVFLLLTFIFRHQLARMFRKVFGRDKR